MLTGPVGIVVRAGARQEPPLEIEPSLISNQPNVRVQLYREAGVTVQEALARA